MVQIRYDSQNGYFHIMKIQKNRINCDIFIFFLINVYNNNMQIIESNKDELVGGKP